MEQDRKLQITSGAIHAEPQLRGAALPPEAGVARHAVGATPDSAVALGASKQ